MTDSERNFNRLSDRIVYALELAVEQQDVDVAEILNNALELAMTRFAGGPDFVERRDYPLEMDTVLNKLGALKEAS